MFSNLEKQIFIVMVLGMVVVILGVFGIGNYGMKFGQSMQGEPADSTFVSLEEEGKQQEREEEREPSRESEQAAQEEEPEEEEESPWTLYENQEAGFSFEYLQAYTEDPELADCQIDQQRQNSFALGQIGIDIVDSEGLGVEAYVDQFVSPRIGPPYYWEVDERNTFSLAGREGLRIFYTFGRQATNAQAVFAPEGNRMFILSLAGGEEFQCQESQAFNRLLETFAL